MYKDGLFIKATIALLCLASVLINGSCDNAPGAEFEPGFIEYSIDWSEVLQSAAPPQVVRYCIYPSGNGAMIQMEGDSKGFELTLPEDEYRLLVFNCDADNIEFRNLDSFDNAEACIPTSASKADGGAPVATATAIPLYGVVVNSLKIKKGESKRALFTPTPLVGNVLLNIDVKGMEYVASCKASLSGVPSSLNLSKHAVVPNKPTTVTFNTERSEKGVSANIMILGIPGKQGEKPVEPVNNVLILDMTLIDGTTASASADLGDKLADIDSPDVVLDVEASVTKSPDFTVHILRWEIALGDSLIIE